MKGLIMGAGITGLAAAKSTGFTVYEARDEAGGICTSYYLSPRQSARQGRPPDDQEAYRFELGGGHWIFGQDAEFLDWLNQNTPYRTYSRKASVYLNPLDVFVPYPIQNHLSFLGQELAQKAYQQILDCQKNGSSVKTMKDWL